MRTAREAVIPVDRPVYVSLYMANVTADLATGVLPHKLQCSQGCFANYLAVVSVSYTSKYALQVKMINCCFYCRFHMLTEGGFMQCVLAIIAAVTTICVLQTANFDYKV